MKDLSKFKFSKDFVGASGSEFKVNLKARYPDLKAREVKALIDREFPDEFQKEQDTKFDGEPSGFSEEPGGSQ